MRDLHPDELQHIHGGDGGHKGGKGHTSGHHRHDRHDGKHARKDSTKKHAHRDKGKHNNNYCA